MYLSDDLYQTVLFSNGVPFEKDQDSFLANGSE